MPKSISYLCPVNNVPTGGVKVIYRHAEIAAKFLPDEIICNVWHPQDLNFRCTWFDHNVTFRQDSTLDPATDFVVIPEVAVAFFAKRLLSYGIRYAIFVQNAYQIHQRDSSCTDEDIELGYRRAEIILSISDNTTQFIQMAYPFCADKIIRVYYSIDTQKFNCSSAKEKLIAYMPRKNAYHTKILLHLLRNSLPNHWKVEPIDNLSETEVAIALGRSRIFLSFSELEGLAIPPLEASLCGNFVVGYTGEGCKEYWSEPNFSEVYSGDFLTFARKVLDRIALIDANDNTSMLNPLNDHLRITFSRENEENHLRQVFDRIAATLI